MHIELHSVKPSLLVIAVRILSGGGSIKVVVSFIIIAVKNKQHQSGMEVKVGSCQPCQIVFRIQAHFSEKLRMLHCPGKVRSLYKVFIPRKPEFIIKLSLRNHLMIKFRAKGSKTEMHPAVIIRSIHPEKGFFEAVFIFQLIGCAMVAADIDGCDVVVRTVGIVNLVPVQLLTGIKGTEREPSFLQCCGRPSEKTALGCRTIRPDTVRKLFSTTYRV